MRNSFQFVRELCDSYGHRLLYLSKFGSHLYGLNTPTSDEDFRGIYLPNINDCFLQNETNNIIYKTNKSNEKNNPEDVDITLISLQTFLKKLMRSGDVNAIDLLFSYDSPSKIFIDDLIKPIFENYDKLLDIYNTKSYIGYCIRETRKYGIKGSRYGALMRVYHYVKDLSNTDKSFSDIRLSQYIDDIDDKYHDDHYCYKKLNERTDRMNLILGAKIYDVNIKMTEVLDRLTADFKIYDSNSLDNIDWKAVSHACRCVIQMNQLLDTGKVVFPFSGKNLKFLQSVKNGEIKWVDVEQYLNDGLISIENRQKIDNHERRFGQYDHFFVDKFIINLYISLFNTLQTN